jgi:hypothetical protein
MDVSIKGLEAEVVARLAQQAEAEGMSAQEWMRQALRRTAALATPRELQARVAGRSPISAARFDETMRAVAARRSASTTALAAGATHDVRHRGR